MIKLEAAAQTTYQITKNSKSVTKLVDTLVIRYVELNLVQGSILAIVDRGQIVNGTLVQSDVTLWIDIQPDGSFLSRDGLWSGKVAPASLLSDVQTSFEHFFTLASAEGNGPTGNVTEGGKGDNAVAPKKP